MRAQTATEYLILLAVVLVIAVIVLGAIGVLPGLGTQADPAVVNQEATTADIGIVDFQLMEGGVQFRLRNNLRQSVKITNISIENEPVSPPSGYPLRLQIGESERLDIFAAVANYSKETVPLEIVYAREDGASYTQDIDVAYSIPQIYLMDGLVALYHFGKSIYDGTEDEVIDYSGNGHHGNATTYFGEIPGVGLFAMIATDGVLGDGVVGSNALMSGLMVEPFNLADLAGRTGTISVWLNDYTLYDGDFKQGIIGNGNDCEITDDQTGGGRKYNFRLSTVDTALNCDLDFGLDASDLNRWKHYAFWWNETACGLHVNGVLHGNDPMSGTDDLLCGSTLYLGNEMGWAAGNAFNGSMDEVAIWSRTLSEDEIKAIYRNGI